MQKMKALRMSERAPEEVSEGTAFERRHATHKRMDRWIRLQQFVFGLPDDYSYAICTTALPNGQFRTRTLVKVGWMTWFGAGAGSDRQHSVAVALLGSGEAISSNSTLVFWHSLTKWIRKGLSRIRPQGPTGRAGQSAGGDGDSREAELMAG